MSKQPIEWHEECLVNMQEYWKRLEATARSAQEEADHLKRNILIREHQIAEAKRRGKDGFDPDRFLVELKPKVGGEDKG